MSSRVPPVPGAPSPEPPEVDEPVHAREPLPPKPDQGAPQPRTATGHRLKAEPEDFGQQGAYLTTAQGARLYDTDHSLKAGPRGPILLQDHHLREKITHFDHERIPERVVHARGAAAHGVFLGYGTAGEVCRAAFLEEGVRTPVFVRFSTVLGSRGSADTVRDTRGFATKFYTSEGVFDLVGNNIPVFFIQDGIKFPDIVHAAKPHPDREIPQAQSAHDTFWDFVSLHTEAQFHTMWNMSDRGIPRSYRMMEGFGIHTFRLTDADGSTSLVKFHWKPQLGIHSLTWEEAQMISGMDPDFHRRDLADAIESGAFPEWELGIQVFPDTPEQTFEGIDLLDPTKIVPEELAPVQAVGRLTLDANPTNYFAETEQVAFHPGHLVPGIDVTDDPLLQVRLFSYLDTQISRLAGPNFAQIPINRTHAPVNDMFRDGWHQDGVHAGVAPYRPNSLDAGCPFTAGADEAAFIEAPVAIPESRKTREQSASFDDHFSQARLFYRSLAPIEQEHLIGAYTFELGKCYEPAIRERQLQALANIDAELCAQVADGLGLPAPEATIELDEVGTSLALSQMGGDWPVAGRMVGILVGADTSTETLVAARDAFFEAGVVPLLIGANGADLEDGTPVQRTLVTARSVEFDALVVTGALGSRGAEEEARDVKAEGLASTGATDPRVRLLLEECWRHGKALGAWGDGVPVLDAVGVPLDGPGVVTDESPDGVVAEVLRLLGGHRVWSRFEAAG